MPVVESQMSTVETLPPKLWLHVKEKADQAFRTGHYSDAVHYYSDAVNACNSASPTDRAKLFANRALAFQREGVPSVVLSSQTRVMYVIRSFFSKVARSQEPITGGDWSIHMHYMHFATSKQQIKSIVPWVCRRLGAVPQGWHVSSFK